MANVPMINDISALRQRAQDQLDRVAYVEHATHLIPLGKRIQRHQKLLERHHLYVVWENDPSDRHPGLYLLKKDHSRWARIWICHNTIRIDAESRHAPYYCDSPYWRDDKLMCRDLSLDLDLAEQAIVRMLERDKLILGDRYLPGHLTADLDGTLRALPTVSNRPPAALPPPTIEAKAVEVSVRPVAPVALRPVGLARKPLQRP